MKLKKDNKAVESLLKSYGRDRVPFVADITQKFSSRKYPFEEINLIKQVLFPRYWNCGNIAKKENSKELLAKIEALGKQFSEGIRPYVEDKTEVETIVGRVLDNLGKVREKLKKDVEAAYIGDPAAKT